MGAYSDVEQALEDQDVSTASGILNGYTPQGHVEDNNNFFYKTYINQQQNGSLSISDSTALITLANGCPHTDGAVVFQARALYNAVFRLNQIFTDNCIFIPDDRESHKDGPKAIPKPANNRFVLYPNPNNGNMFISFSDVSVKEYFIRVFDITGKQIIEKQISAEGGLAQLNLPLANGMYFVSMMLPNGTSSNQQKLVISK
jgi:hypothetical protein